jgi:hypothetical protein
MQRATWVSFRLPRTLALASQNCSAPLCSAPHVSVLAFPPLVNPWDRACWPCPASSQGGIRQVVKPLLAARIRCPIVGLSAHALRITIPHSYPAHTGAPSRIRTRILPNRTRMLFPVKPWGQNDYSVAIPASLPFSTRAKSFTALATIKPVSPLQLETTLSTSSPARICRVDTMISPIFV